LVYQTQLNSTQLNSTQSILVFLLQEMDTLKTFVFDEDNKINVIQDDITGELLFDGTDVAQLFGYKDYYNLGRYLTVDAPLKKRGKNFLTEPMLYEAIFKSRSDQATLFRQRVTKVVLPSIRRT
jgi:prophage antirepressor-like protein